MNSTESTQYFYEIVKPFELKFFQPVCNLLIKRRIKFVLFVLLKNCSSASLVVQAFRTQTRNYFLYFRSYLVFLEEPAISSYLGVTKKCSFMSLRLY